MTFFVAILHSSVKYDLYFQHFIGMIASFIIAAVPDVPKDVKVQIHRENELEQQMLFDDGNDHGNRKASIANNSNGFDPDGTMTAKDIPSFDQNSNSNQRWSI